MKPFWHWRGQFIEQIICIRFKDKREKKKHENEKSKKKIKLEEKKNYTYLFVRQYKLYKEMEMNLFEIIIPRV